MWNIAVKTGISGSSINVYNRIECGKRLGNRLYTYENINDNSK